MNKYNAKAWGHASILNYFDHHRLCTNDVYPSEWFFLSQKIVENISVLDIGCAKGGMANVLSQHIQNFHYTGIDINHKMISDAQHKYPQHDFYHVNENNYSSLKDKQYDIVLCLGILHLHETWKDTLASAWAHTKGCLILDLRETFLASIEDKNISYFKMDFDQPDSSYSEFVLPYNIINTAEALQIIQTRCKNFKKISHYGYSQEVSELTVSTIKNVMANVYCIER